MAANLKPYLFTKGADGEADREFAAARKYGHLRLGQTSLFWRAGLRWHRIPLSGVKRIFRRVVPVVGKLCCGSQTFLIEMLVLVLPDGTNLELYIGDDLEKDAKALYQALQEAHPELEYGVVKYNRK